MQSNNVQDGQNTQIKRRVVSTKDAAETLGVDPRTVQRLVKATEIEGFKVGRQYRIYEDSLTAYIKRHTFTSAVVDNG